MWLKRPHCTKKALQQLVGRLVHLCSCITPGRKFVSRILYALSRAHYVKKLEVDQDMLRDVHWFRDYASSANGVAVIPPRHLTQWVIECDSCMSGGGAFSPELFYAEQYDYDFTQRFPTIHLLEAANLVEAVASLQPPYPAGIMIVINTDNLASACALQSGRC